MKVISLRQPWASLVVMGAKQIETRSRNTKYRGTLLIHASLNNQDAIDLVPTDPFNRFIRHWNDLPFGAIIGSVELVETSHTENFVSISQNKIKSGWSARIDWETELKFGDYSKGRYGYLLKNHFKFKDPIPAKGSVMIPWEFNHEILLKDQMQIK